MPRRRAEAPEPSPIPALEPAAVWRPVGELRPWAKNPRKNEKAVLKVARSIVAYGWGRPITARAKNSEVVVGHTARLAALELPRLLAEGYEPPDKRWHPEALRTAKEGLVPVRSVELSAEKAHRLALADNKLGEISEWDDELLLEQLRLTPDEERELAGWSAEEFEKLEADEPQPGADEEADYEVDDPADGRPGLAAPFPWFGGKRDVVNLVWRRFGKVKQYVEPFCGSAALLLGAPQPASLEVVNDANGFVANFWRCMKHQPREAALAADYPVSHVDLGARHVWLIAQRGELQEKLRDPDWPGDAKIAGWWVWGQCCWIGSGWCRDVDFKSENGPHPGFGNTGRGIQAAGQIPLVGNVGRGIQAAGQILTVADDGFLTSSGRVAAGWFARLAARLERVRVMHGDWSRCLNHHYGGDETAVFLDPPYKAYEALYGAAKQKGAAAECEEWARANAGIKVAICGHVGDYDLPGWSVVRWKRKRLTYGSDKTTKQEAIWFSPACSG